MSDELPAIDPAKTWALKSLPYTRQVSVARFSPCGKFVFAASQDFSIQRWTLDGEEDSPPVALAGHTSWIGDLAFVKDGQRMISADYHGNIHCWPYAADKPAPIWSVKDAHQGWIRCMAASPDGKWLLTAGVDRKPRVWNTADGKLVRELAEHKGDIFSCEFHPRGKSLVTGDQFGTVREFTVDDGKLVRELDASPLHSRGDDSLADTGGVRRMKFNSDATLLACSGMTDIDGNTFCPGKPAVLVLEWSSGKVTHTLRPKDKLDGYIGGLCYLPENILAAYGENMNGTGGLWFWKPGEIDPFHTVKGTSGYQLDVHPDGRRLAAPVFQSKGGGGNGRPAKTPEEYFPNAGAVQIFAMWQQPPKDPKAKAKKA